MTITSVSQFNDQLPSWAGSRVRNWHATQRNLLLAVERGYRATQESHPGVALEHRSPAVRDATRPQLVSTCPAFLLSSGSYFNGYRYKVFLWEPEALEGSEAGPQMSLCEQAALTGNRSTLGETFIVPVA